MAKQKQNYISRKRTHTYFRTICPENALLQISAKCNAKRLKQIYRENASRISKVVKVVKPKCFMRIYQRNSCLQILTGFINKMHS